MKLDSAIFYTNDIEKIKKFYTEIIGLQVEYQQEDKYLSLMFDNKVRLGIKKAVEQREKPGSQTLLVGVEDIETYYKKFKGLGINFIKDLEKRSWGTEFSLADPDNNKIEFIQRA